MKVRQIAEDKYHWETFVDPNNNDPGAFDRMTVEERMRTIVELWPLEVDPDDAEGLEIVDRLG